MAVKGGVETSESTSLARPIGYFEYDNLGMVVASELYDGDGVSVTDGNSDGVPDRPSSLLRAKSTFGYHDQGRLYQADTYSVDQSTGSVSTDSLTSEVWYSRRDEVIKVSGPGGPLVGKYQYDGLGRLTASYVSDGLPSVKCAEPNCDRICNRIKAVSIR